MPHDGSILTRSLGERRTTRRIHLYGHLAERFGPYFDLGVDTPASAVRVLSVLIPGFREAITEGDYRVIRGDREDGLELSTALLHLRLPPDGQLHIIPMAAGSGGHGGGFGKIILGVALVAGAVFTAGLADVPIAGGASAAIGGAAGGAVGLSAGGLGAAAVLGLSYGQIAIAGGLLILAGVSALLSPQPKKPTDTANTASFLLGGQLNVTTQGVPVPVVYGVMRVGSVTISSGFYTEDYTAAPGSNSSGVVSTPGSFDASTHVYGSGSGGGGGGKKGGGGSGTPTEDPNTLRSKALIRIIDVLSEGPIGGLVNGAQSIFFNNTPLQNADGTFNFQGVSWTLLLGLPDQAPVPGFSAAEDTVALGGGGIDILYNLPHTEQISMAVADGANAVRVTVQIPALYQEDTTHGNLIYGPPLAYKFEIRPTGTSGWILAVNENIVGGKCMAPYQRSYRINLPASTTGWDLRMTRLTHDSTSAAIANNTQWFAYVLITDHLLIYPDTAYIALQIDSASFGSTIPARTYQINGIQVAVPANYDPVGHNYSTSGPGTSGGTWDLVSTKPATTDDPCWNLLDMLENQRYGMAIRPESINATRADLYIISQYCNARVPDGYSPTSTEVRYTMNTVMSSQIDAFSAIQSMCSAFRGMVHWGAGRLVVTADMPKAISKVVNEANVIDGEFTREGTSLQQRHTVYNVTWRDPANNYVPTIEVVEDFDQVAARTSVPADIVAYGCTSRGLARRLGKWMLYTERSATETLSYKAGLYHLDLSPGEMIVQTDRRVGVRLGGRILQSYNEPGPGNTVLVLDATFNNDPAQTYEIYCVQATGEAVLHTVAAFVNFPGLTTYVVLADSMAVSELPRANTEFLLLGYNPTTGTGSVPYQYQVIALSEYSKGQFGITALIADPGRFAWIEYGIKLEPNSYYLGTQLQNVMLTPMLPVTNVTAHSTIAGIGTSTFSRIIVSFTPTPDIRTQSFQCEAVMTVDSHGGAQPNVNLGMFSGPASPIVIDNMPGGTYTFGVRSVGTDGRVSAWAYAQSIATAQANDAPDPPSGLSAIGGTRRVQLNWTIPLDRDVYFFEVWRGSSAGQGPGAGAVEIGTSGGNTYQDADGNTLRPNTTWYYWVRTFNTTLAASPFAGPVSATTTLLIVDDLAEGIINAALFAQGIQGVALVTSLPTNLATVGGSLVIFNETDHQLYRYEGLNTDGTVIWTKAIAAPDVAGQLTDAQIASLAAAKLAGQLVASQLAAGSVTTIQLDVGSGTNVIWNGNLSNVPDGWSMGSSRGPTDLSYNGPVRGGPFDPNWVLQGDGTGMLHCVSVQGVGDFMVAAWDPNYLDPGSGGGSVGVPVTPGVWYEAQAMVNCQACASYVAIQFFDGTNTNVLSTVAGNRTVFSAGSGAALYDYALTWCAGVAPAGAVKARYVLYALNDGGADIGQPPSEPAYLFFTHCSLGPTVASPGQPAAWAPGGITNISGGVIKTNTLNADRIIANSITTDKLAANSITTGTIAAGAIKSAQIDVGVIKSYMLASDFILAYSAQLGTAVIGTAQIQNLSVGTGQIGNGAISAIGVASYTGTGVVPQFSYVIAAQCVVPIYDAGDFVVLVATVDTGQHTTSAGGVSYITYLIQRSAAGHATINVSGVDQSPPTGVLVTYTLLIVTAPPISGPTGGGVVCQFASLAALVMRR